MVMTPDEVKRVLVEVLTDVAPDIDPGTVPYDEDIRDSLDIDSMDFLNFVSALHKRFGVDIPEAEYSELFTISGGVAYLLGKFESGAAGMDKAVSVERSTRGSGKN